MFELRRQEFIVQRVKGQVFEVNRPRLQIGQCHEMVPLSHHTNEYVLVLFIYIGNIKDCWVYEWVTMSYIMYPSNCLVCKYRYECVHCVSKRDFCQLVLFKMVAMNGGSCRRA